MTVKLASALPKDDKNGLATIAPELAKRYYEGGATTAIVVLETLGVNHEDGDRIPKVGVLRIEPLEGDLETKARGLLQQATEQRVGKKPNTLDLSESGGEFGGLPTAVVRGDAEITDGVNIFTATSNDSDDDVVDAEVVDDDVEGGDAA